MKTLLLLLILFFALSCSNQQRDVNWDPFYPNEGITIKQLASNGFELSNVEHSMCVYFSFQKNKTLYFYANQIDDCEDIFGQELYVKLGPNDNSQSLSNELINKIDSILISYNSKRTGEIERISECTYNFEATNRNQKTINWNILLCGEQIEILASSDV